MKGSLLIVCILIFSFLVCGCTSLSSNTSKDAIPSDKYVAILEEYTNQSTLIGTPPRVTISPLPIPTPDPTFDYNNQLGQLQYELGPYGITVNDSFKILVGKISLYDTPITLGYMGIGLTSVYTLPYTMDAGFTIVNVTSNGTIFAMYQNQSIILKPGENWTTTSSANITLGYLANKFNTSEYMDYTNMTIQPWPVHNDLTYTFTNRGLLNKSLINNSYANK